MSVDIGELRRLLDKLENWPKNAKGYPAESPSLTIIRLHKLTDAALPALLDVAEAARAAWTDPGPEQDALLDALARLDFGEGT